MKKKIIKITLFLFCLVAVIFFLLPFLETATSHHSALKAAEPQVSSDNPLTAIAKRLAALFGRGEHRSQPLSASSPEQPAGELLAGEYALRFAGGKAGGSETVAQTADSNPETLSDRFGDAVIQTDTGEWVLVRQTAPQGAGPGMHEINVHENPYDRYLRQERARHFQPQTQAQSIPDSKWARFTRPIKRFLGLESPQPVANSPLSLAQMQDRAARLQGASQEAQSGAKTSSFGNIQPPVLDISPLAWAKLTAQQRERASASQFLRMLSGEQSADAAASVRADAAYPNPKNAKEAQEKENYRQRLSEENKALIKTRLLEAMQANAAGQAAVDELEYMMGCGNSSLPSEFCDLEHVGQVPAAASAQEIAQEQLQNRALFLEKTNYVFPGTLPFTVVLGPTNPDTLAELAEKSPEGVKQAAKIYQFLYAQRGCDTRPCFWVANNPQLDPQLTDAVSMANGVLKKDPLGVYPKQEEAYIAHELTQYDENTDPTTLEQVREEAHKQFTEHAVHYVPYLEEEMKQVQDNVMATQQNPFTATENEDAPPLIFVANAHDAPEVARVVGSPLILYHRGSLSESKSPSHAGQEFTLSIGANVKEGKDAADAITAQAGQESLQTHVRQQGNKGLKDLMNLPAQSGSRAGKPHAKSGK